MAKNSPTVVFLLFLVLPYAARPCVGAAAKGGGALQPRLLVLYRRSADGSVLTPAPASLAGLTSHGRLGEAIEKFTISDGQTVEQKVVQLEADAAVHAAEPDVLKHRMSVTDSSQEASQWALRAIDAGAAWDVLTDASAVTVCVIDTGIDYNHPDLKPNMSPLRGNDYSDDVGVIAGTAAEKNNNSPFQDTDPMDTSGHGSHVAGIIGAVGNNDAGTVGIAWKVQLLACKIFDESDFGSLSALINCYRYCRLNGAKIMTASFAGPDFSRIEKEELQHSVAAGQLLVVAAGNDEDNLDRAKLYPASYGLPNIITVAASDKRDRLAWYSDWGPRTVHLAAPGTAILSTWKRGGYSTQSGTSQAAPQVAGAAALVWAAAGPGATAAQVKRLLLDSVDTLPAFAGKVASGGRLNVGRAVAAARGLCYTPAAAGAAHGTVAACGSKKVVKATFAAAAAKKRQQRLARAAALRKRAAAAKARKPSRRLLAMA